MRAWMLAVLCVVGGCACTRRPHWQIVVSATIESQLDPQIKATGTIEFRPDGRGVAPLPLP